MTSRLARVARHLLGMDGPPGGTSTDRQLLERFLRNRDQAAFAAILERHGPMVRGVCRRVLGRSADADDAFQATFLVLVRRATSVSWHESLGGWLHTVACRVAHKARSNATRAADAPYRTVPQEVPTVTDADPPTAAAHRELCVVLDEELARLPAKYRLPLVLCYLEGRTNEEAALQLGWTKGTVSGRLARARDLLRGRLARRGLALSVAALEIVLTETASATLPAALFDSTLKAAVLSATGSAAVVGAVSARAITLTEGVSKAMFLTRVKIATAALLAFCLFATGATVVTYRALARERKELSEVSDPRTLEPADRSSTGRSTDDEKLQGTWTVVNAESLQKGTQWTFNGGQLKGYSQPDGEIITSYKLDPEQKPKSIDLTGQVGTDGPLAFQLKGIYQLDGDELRVHFASGEEGRPKAFPTDAPARVLIFKREPPVKVVFQSKQDGKPPMRTYFVSLELTNPRDQPVWLVTRYSGDEALTPTGKFLEQQDGKPQMFGGDGFDGTKAGGKGAAVEMRYVGCFRAFYLAPKTTIRFDRYPITCWKDIDQFELWEVSSLQVNGRTALEKWLPYPTRNEGDIRIPAQTNSSNLDWDAKTARSRTDYPKERIEFVTAEVIRKWLVPIAKADGKEEKPKTDLEALQGTWHAVAGEFMGKPMTKDELAEDGEKLVIRKDEFVEYMGDFAVVANLKLDPTKKPKTFDLITHLNVLEGNVKRVTESVTGTGIYELDGETLKIARAGRDEVRPTGFKTTADTKFAVCTYKRGEPPAKPGGPKQPEFVEAEITLHLGRDGVTGEPQTDLKKTVKDKATLAKFVSCFPEAGRDKKSNTAGGWIARMTFKFTGSKGETVTVSSTWTNWSEGKGDWLVKANLTKFAGELFEVPRLTDEGNLMDDWQIVTFEEGGQKRDTKNVEFDVTHNGVELRVGDKAEWEAEYTIDPSKKPREIDLRIEPYTKNAKTYQGIYLIENDTLKICLDKGGKARPTGFKTPVGNANEVLLVLRRKSSIPAPDVGPGDLDTLRKKLKSGTPAEKQQVLTTIQNLQAIKLIPEVIEAIADPTALPREGDTGWGFVGHQAASLMCALAQAIDGTDRGGRREYTFHDDQYKGGEKLKESGRLEEVRKNWARWRDDHGRK